MPGFTDHPPNPDLHRIDKKTPPATVTRHYEPSVWPALPACCQIRIAHPYRYLPPVFLSAVCSGVFMFKRVLLPVCTLLLTACASPDYIRFSQEFRDAEGFEDSHLRKLQFYVCPELVIERELTLSETGITSGRLIRKQGRMINQVVIPKWTPGVAVNTSENYLAISFEEGTALAFGVEKNVYTGDYAPLGKNEDKGFQVMYDGAWYYLIDPKDDDRECKGTNFNESRLWIDADSLKEVTTNRKVLKGRTID
jgi:hypothetical protein